jgi:hypothetical protein
MTPTNAKLKDFVDHYHTRDPLHVPSEKSDRLWVHDMIHAVLGTSITSGKGELETAIYQAVLLRDHSCSTQLKKHCDANHVVSENVIEERVLSGLQKFLEDLGKRNGFTPKAMLSAEEIRDHYYTALALRTILEKKFTSDGLGSKLGEVSIETLGTVS